jgi:hypothetical protein
MGIVPGVTQAQRHRAPQGFRGQHSVALWCCLPPEEGANNTRVAEGIDPKWRTVAQHTRQDAPDCSTDCTTDIDPKAVQQHRRGQVFARHKFCYHGLPCWGAHGARCADQKGHHEQAQRGDQAARDEHRQRYAERHDCHLAPDEELPTIDDICKGACGQSEEEQGQVACNLDQRHDKWVRVKGSDQPASCGGRDPTAESGD